MSEEILSDVLDDKADYLAYKKQKTIEKLGERTHLTLGKIAKLVNHEDHGAVVGDITLQELIDVQVKAQLEEALEEAMAANLQETDSEEAAEEEVPRPVAKATKKSAKKAPAAKKKATAKKTAKAPAAKKKTVRKRSVASSSAQDGRKADFGKKKPRLKRDQGYKEILAALKAANEPCGRGDLEEATGYTGVQVRTFCKELADQGKVQILGKGGRSTKYALA